MCAALVLNIAAAQELVTAATPAQWIAAAQEQKTVAQAQVSARLTTVNQEQPDC